MVAVKILGLLVMAAALAAPAAAAPDGFRESSRLKPIAAKIAPAATVACASSAWTWRDDVSDRYPNISYGQINGYTVFPSDVRFAPAVCVSLENWLRGKNVPDIYTLAESTFTFVHELVHARGVQDESIADCTALKELPTILRDRFHVKRQATRTKVMREAWRLHRQKPPEYRVSC